MIDTGASATIILDRDVERLGLDWNRLTPADHQLGGIGGSVETRLIPDGTLSFTATSGNTVRERLKIYVARHDLKAVGGRRQFLIRDCLTWPELERLRSEGYSGD